MRLQRIDHWYSCFLALEGGSLLRGLVCGLLLSPESSAPFSAFLR